MPTSGPLVDRRGRVHRDLRLSVTDRCDLRCVYCMPEDGMVFRPHRELLSLSELTRVAAVARRLGVHSVRLTGGEPLLRRGLARLVDALRTLRFDDIAMTTNGMTLARHAQSLADAGLHRVNVSCDTLRPQRFPRIRRRGDLGTVLGAMEAAEQAGLSPLKVNVVLVAGRNDDEIVDFARFARTTGRTVRFIEFMPLDHEEGWSESSVVPGARVLEEIDAVFPLRADQGRGSAPAERYSFADGSSGAIGVVRSVTEPFCGDCDRLRVTADGMVRNCLFSDDERSLRPALLGSDEDVALVLREAVWAKRAAFGRDAAEPVMLRPRRSMSMIGG
jgi:cyclic pyranopterin phosphate synthase